MSKVNTALLNYPARPNNIIPKSTRELAELIGVKYDRLGLTWSETSSAELLFISLGAMT